MLLVVEDNAAYGPKDMILVNVNGMVLDTHGATDLIRSSSEAPPLPQAVRGAIRLAGVYLLLTLARCAPTKDRQR